MTTPDHPDLPAADVFQAQRLAAAARWRLEQTWGGLRWTVLGAAVVFVFWALLTLLVPGAVRPLPWGFALGALAILVTVALAWIRPPDWPRIHRRMDRQLGLPDAVLSSAELGAGPWTAPQLAQTAGGLRGTNWRRAWPVAPSRTLVWSTVAAVLAGSFLAGRFQNLVASERPAPPTVAQSEQAAALREMLADWDKSEREQPDPELKKLLADLRPLREQLAHADRVALDERETFKQISRVEERLAATRAALEAESLQPVAAEMAAALEGVDGLGGMAAAVRRGDFEKAEEQAAEAAKQFAQSSPPKLPEGARANEAAGRFGKLAQSLQQNGRPAAAGAMSQMQTALQQRDAQKMSASLKACQQCLGGQNGRDRQAKSMALQLRQMGLCKNCQNSGDNLGQCLSLLPKLSMQRSQKAGKGAGSETNLARAGAETALAADRRQENLSGVADPSGDSETTTTTSLEPPTERTGPGVAANFQRYEQLSQQAVEDESLPLAHRQTIRRYFESIRPTGK